MNQELLQTIKEVIRNNLSDENFGPLQLAKIIGMSHSTLHRRIKEITGKTISRFIREIRLEKAKEILQHENFTVSEIAYKVGFGSPTYFNKCFHEHYGITPGEFKKLEIENLEKTINSRWNLQKVLLFIIAPVFIFLLVGSFLNEKFSILKKEVTVEKSIAIRPLAFLSDEPEKEYLADGLRDAVIQHLSAIKNLRVMSSTSISPESVESSAEIGKRLNISHIVDGSLQLADEKMNIILHLINTRDERTEWSKNFTCEQDNWLEVQGLIAKTIADQLNIAITPEEKLSVEKIDEVDIDALDFYHRGNYEYLQYSFNNQNLEALNNAELFFRGARDLDSTFPPAYTGLAKVYLAKYYDSTYFSDSFLEPIKSLAEMALKFDHHFDEAYLLRGMYYQENDNLRKALNDFNMSIEINPNCWQAYDILCNLYTWIPPDFVKAIENGHKGIVRNYNNKLPDQFSKLGFAYSCAGFFDEADKCFETSFKLNGGQDSCNYYQYKGTLEEYKGNYQKAKEYLDKSLKLDTTFSNLPLLRRVGGNYMFLGDFEKSLYYYNLWNEKMNQQGRRDLGELHRIALACDKTGDTINAIHFFQLQEKYCLESIKKGRDFAQNKRAHYDLAGVYAYNGETDKVYNYLEEILQLKAFPLWWLNHFKDDPLFESIREQERFQNIIKQLEDKYITEHERVKDWQEKNGIIFP